MNSRHLTSVCVLFATVQVATAANIPVVPKKLVVVDKIVAAGKAKVAFVVKDPAVTKGASEDAEQISVQVDLAYGNGSAAGAFVVPAGTASGWVVNKATVAKYVNKSAPGGPTEAKVAVIKPAKLLKLVGKGLGDAPFDILAAGPPSGSVFTAYCVDNAGEENCHCSEFTGCVHKSIGGGTGAKLVCKTGVGDGVCTASVPATTTTTSTSTTTTTAPPLECCDIPTFSVCTLVTASDCVDVYSGTVGASGSVCDGSGGCVAPPASPGLCGQDNSSDQCFGGPDASLCSAFGGCTVFGGQVCTPTGCQ